MGPGSSYQWGEIAPINRVVTPSYIQFPIYFRPFPQNHNSNHISIYNHIDSNRRSLADDISLLKKYTALPPVERTAHTLRA